MHTKHTVAAVLAAAAAAAAASAAAVAVAAFNFSCLSVDDEHAVVNAGSRKRE